MWVLFILPCKPLLNLLFLIVWLWASCYYSFFLNNFFLLAFCVADIVRSQISFFISTNLIQIEEKTHVPVTVRFPGYAFYENIHIYRFQEWDVFLIYLFFWQTQELSKQKVSKIKTLLSAPFSIKLVIFPVRSIALANWFSYVTVWTSAIARVSLRKIIYKD